MDDQQVLEILKMISHPTRLEILKRIHSQSTEGGVTCSCVLDGLEISQSTLSHHISELAQSGLIKTTNRGRFNLLEVDQQVWEEFQKKLSPTIFG